MPFDQNGNYKRLYGPTGWQDDRDAGTKILATRHDDDDNDKAEAFNQCFLSDGRKVATGDFKMGGHKIKGLADADAPADATNVQQVQSGKFNFAKDISTEENSIKANLFPAPDKLPNAMLVSVQVANDNTGHATLQLNTLPAKPILLGEQELGARLLRAGRTYLFFYNQTLDAFQLVPSGSFVGRSVPPGAMVMLDYLLTGEDAVGYELQGSRCYKSKYWAFYQKLSSEYADSVERTETIGEKQFTYKVNLDSMRRFYSKQDYEDRFVLCGDTGGYILDEETFSFWLPKTNNYFRATITADNLSAYQQDTIRKMEGDVGRIHLPDRGDTKTTAPFEVTDAEETWVGQDGDAPNQRYVAHLNTALLGENFGGEETAPKSRFVAIYYYLGEAYTTPIEQTSGAGAEGGGGGSGKPPVLTWHKDVEGSSLQAAEVVDAALVKVYKNGLLLEPEADYSISSEEIIFVTELELQDKITTEVY